MERMKRLRKGLIAAWVIGLGIAGCGHDEPAPFPDWSQRANASGTSSAPSPNAFDLYAKAAEEAESQGERYLKRVSYTPGMQRDVLRKMSGPMQQVRRGTTMPPGFRFEPREPFAPAAHHAGWRLVGSGLVWSIQIAAAEGEFDSAVASAVAATTFGFDLTAGSAVDASLGLSIADEARVAIAPHLRSMSTAQLDTLARGIRKALERKPTLVEAMDNEHRNIVLGIQMIQDVYRDGKLDLLREKMGVEVREAVAYLADLKKKDADARPAYFEGFMKEAEEETEWLKRAALLPAVKRPHAQTPRLASSRPWKRFAKHLVRTGRPLLEINDATLARTRLLYLEAYVLTEIRRTGQAPETLDAIPLPLRQDPYTGTPLLYRASGAEHHLYSSGSNFRDDGGETDETLHAPDLLLEIPRT
jgi:hypothetical protein